MTTDLRDLLTSPTESMVPISFRGTSEDRRLMEELGQVLGVTPSATVRLGLRLMHDLASLPRLTLILGRVHVNRVLRQGKSV